MSSGGSGGRGSGGSAAGVGRGDVSGAPPPACVSWYGVCACPARLVRGSVCAAYHPCMMRSGRSSCLAMVCQCQGSTCGRLT